MNSNTNRIYYTKMNLLTLFDSLLDLLLVNYKFTDLVKLSTLMQIEFSQLL